MPRTHTTRVTPSEFVDTHNALIDRAEEVKASIRALKEDKLRLDAFTKWSSKLMRHWQDPKFTPASLEEITTGLTLAGKKLLKVSRKPERENELWPAINQYMQEAVDLLESADLDCSESDDSGAGNDPSLRRFATPAGASVPRPPFVQATTTSDPGFTHSP
ncbi:hypothetical protein OIO90_006113 [Microbotryomycetes sp. JL221]|nr:hypothetical protein OIO90_006113 [Microbotryomycetes sp. JL221]